MSTVLIIGASRGIGLETVKLALKAGHSVRALARSATAIRLHDPKLEDVDSGALVQHTIERALVGVDAVIQTLGVSPTPEPILGGTRLLSVASNMQGSVALVHVVQNPIKEVLLESLSRCTTNCALLCQQRRSI